MLGYTIIKIGDINNIKSELCKEIQSELTLFKLKNINRIWIQKVSEKINIEGKCIEYLLLNPDELKYFNRYKYKNCKDHKIIDFENNHKN